jgi:hypothetical protein
MSSSQQPPSPIRCSICPNAGTLICPGCQDIPLHAGTKYCSKECQSADWANHKELHRAFKERKTLFRAAEVLQAVYYIYLEATIVSKPKRIERFPGRMIVHVNPLAPLEAPFSGFADEQEKFSFLTSISSSRMVRWMQDILVHMTKGKPSSFNARLRELRS